MRELHRRTLPSFFWWTVVLPVLGNGASPTDIIIDTDMSIDVDDVRLTACASALTLARSCLGLLLWLTSMRRCSALSVPRMQIGMLCAAHALADNGEARIRAVVHDSGASVGVGAISVISRRLPCLPMPSLADSPIICSTSLDHRLVTRCIVLSDTYFGRGNVPIGAYRGPIGNQSFTTKPGWTNNGRGVYNDYLLAGLRGNHFSRAVDTARQVPDARDVLRTTLAGAADGSITIIAVGFATNLLSLLLSRADHISAHTGVWLVERKVKRLVFMGGRHRMRKNQPVEWNFGGVPLALRTCRHTGATPSCSLMLCLPAMLCPWRRRMWRRLRTL